MSPSPLQSICVYCGSADGVHPEYYRAAVQLGELLARGGIRLIYGGGKIGLMGTVAESVLHAGGRVTGVISEKLNTPTLAHTGLTEFEVLPDIQNSKARMSALADGFIALPGGYGTMDELFETLTRAQIGLHQKPVGLLNARGYYDPLMAFLNRALEEKFIYPEHMELLVIDSDPERLLEKMQAFQLPTNLDRWVNRDVP